MKRPTRKAPASARVPGPLAEALGRVLQERGLSARGASLAAGLSGDAVRNILSGRSRSPRTEAVQALADSLGVSVAQLQGREALPPPGTPLTAVAPSGMVSLLEVEFVSRGRAPHGEDELERVPGRTWSVPSDVFESTGVRTAKLFVVRAPTALGSVRRGDRLVVDGADAEGSPPGHYLLWDGWSLTLARCSLAKDGEDTLLRMEHAAGVSELPAQDVAVLGRVVAAWAWL